MAPGSPQGKRGGAPQQAATESTPSRPTPSETPVQDRAWRSVHAPHLWSRCGPNKQKEDQPGSTDRDPHRGTRETPTDLPPRSTLNTWETCISALACRSTVQPRGARRRIGPRLYPGVATRETAESNHLANKNTNMPLQTKRGKQNTRAGTEPHPPLLTRSHHHHHRTPPPPDGIRPQVTHSEPGPQSNLPSPLGEPT